MPKSKFGNDAKLIPKRKVATTLEVSTDAVSTAVKVLGLRPKVSPTGREDYSLVDGQQLEKHFSGR